MTELDALLATLAGHEVTFIGWVEPLRSRTARRGSHRTWTSYDQRTAANLDRLVAALAHATPYLRGAPPGLPFIWDRATLERGLNFTLITSLGDIDLLGGDSRWRNV